MDQDPRPYAPFRRKTTSDKPRVIETIVVWFVLVMIVTFLLTGAVGFVLSLIHMGIDHAH